MSPSGWAAPWEVVGLLEPGGTCCRPSPGCWWPAALGVLYEKLSGAPKERDPTPREPHPVGRGGPIVRGSTGKSGTPSRPAACVGPGHSGVCPPPGGLAGALAQLSGCLPRRGCCACRAPPNPAAGVGALGHGVDVALGPRGSGAEGHLLRLFRNLCPGGSLSVPSAPAWGSVPLVVPCVLDPEPLEQGCVLSPSQVRREPSRRQLAGLAELRPPHPRDHLGSQITTCELGDADLEVCPRRAPNSHHLAPPELRRQGPGVIPKQAAPERGKTSWKRHFNARFSAQ